MATTTSIASTYAGEFAGKYISAALLSANTIDKGGIEVMPNIITHMVSNNFNDMRGYFVLSHQT